MQEQVSVFLLLIDRTSVPQFRSEKILCSIIDTAQPPGTVAPSTLTHDNIRNRSHIIRQLDSLTKRKKPITDAVATIGEAVWHDLGLIRLLQRINKPNNEITFISNDSIIPWEWASPDNLGQLCMRLSCGNLTFEQLAHTSAQARPSVGNRSDYLQKMNAVLLFDTGGHHNLERLVGVQNEIQRIRKTLITAGLSRNNVQIIDGNDNHAEPLFLKALRTSARENLRLIYYVGHLAGSDLQLRHSAIESAEIAENFHEGYLPQPLVFVNGANRDPMIKRSEDLTKLSTAWLGAGALGVIMPRIPLSRTKSALFAEAFIKNIFAEEHQEHSIGIVLRDTREQFAESKTDSTALTYTLVGHPCLQLLPSNKTKAEQIVTTMAEADAPKGFKKVMDMEVARIQPWADIHHKEFLVEADHLGDIETERLLQNVEKYGICLLRIAGLESEKYVIEEVAAGFGKACDKQNKFVGKVKEIKPEEEGLANSGDTTDNLGLHVDGTQHEDQPDILIFQYVVPPKFGAQSVFVDAAKVILDIDEGRLQRTLVNLAQRDAARFKKRGMSLTAPVFSIASTDHSIKCRLRFDDVITPSANCVQDFEYLKEIFNDEKYRTSFRPRDGDIVIFDNTRVLHARTKIHRVAGRMHRRMWISALKSNLRSKYLLGVRPLGVETLAAIKQANNAK